MENGCKAFKDKSSYSIGIDLPLRYKVDGELDWEFWTFGRKEVMFLECSFSNCKSLKARVHVDLWGGFDQEIRGIHEHLGSHVAMRLLQ